MPDTHWYCHFKKSHQVYLKFWVDQNNRKYESNTGVFVFVCTLYELIKLYHVRIKIASTGSEHNKKIRICISSGLCLCYIIIREMSMSMSISCSPCHVSFNRNTIYICET